MVRTYGRLAGRGNLRENREDPAPTVGIVGRTLRPLPPMNDAARLGTRRLVRAALGGDGQLSARPHSTDPTEKAIANLDN